jgi:hypothetical protein
VGPVLRLHHDVRPGEGRVHVTGSTLDGQRDVVRPLRHEPGRVVSERLERVDQDGPRLVGDVDELDRVLGDVAIGRDDDRDRLSHVGDAAVSEQRKRLDPDQRSDGTPHRLGGPHLGLQDQRLDVVTDGRPVEDCHDPGERPRGVEIDRGDRGGSDGTAQEGDLERSGDLEIVRVGAQPAQQCVVLDAGDPLTDQGRTVLSGDGRGRVRGHRSDSPSAGGAGITRRAACRMFRYPVHRQT